MNSAGEVHCEPCCELGCREKSLPDVMGNLNKVLAGRESTLLSAVKSL
jgi:hypothetical protein